MAEKFNKILDDVLQGIPQSVTLNLPKLKKVNDKKDTKIKLPKLKKVT